MNTIRRSVQFLMQLYLIPTLLDNLFVYLIELFHFFFLSFLVNSLCIFDNEQVN